MAKLRYNPEGDKFEVEIEDDLYGPFDVPEDDLEILTDDDTGKQYLVVTSGFEGDQVNKVYELTEIETTVVSGEFEGDADDDEGDEEPEEAEK